MEIFITGMKVPKNLLFLSRVHSAINSFLLKLFLIKPPSFLIFKVSKIKMQKRIVDDYKDSQTRS